LISSCLSWRRSTAKRLRWKIDAARKVGAVS
jgi:hypothetical protein